MKRTNPYEAAFEGYLQWHKLCYVAVDETRRSYLGERTVKSLDFIVHGDQGARLLIDVKGRRYPGGKAERPRGQWECWSLREDVESLLRWADRFGAGYQPVLLFLYEIMSYAQVNFDGEDLWTWHDRRYVLRAVDVEEYAAWMRRRSPKWDTVCLPSAVYRRIWRPLDAFLAPAAEAYAD